MDGQNVHLGVKQQGWRVDWARFRIYLRERYGVEKAFIFLGYVEGNEGLYLMLREAGFVCVFKPISRGPDGRVKGNCDAELVLKAALELPNYEKAVIVSGDGDFYCLVEHLRSVGKIRAILVPDRACYSMLLKVFGPRLIDFMNDLERRIGLPK